MNIDILIIVASYLGNSENINLQVLFGLPEEYRITQVLDTSPNYKKIHTLKNIHTLCIRNIETLNQLSDHPKGSTGSQYGPTGSQYGPTGSQYGSRDVSDPAWTKKIKSLIIISPKPFTLVDKWFSVFENLYELSVSWNNNIHKIKLFPTEIGPYIRRTLENLWTFKCCGNSLDQLPNHFKNIRVLYCSYNKLTELPSSGLENLKILDCSNNNIKTLPNNMYNLEELDCSSNSLESLPTGLENLEILDFSNTNIKKLPQDLKSMKCLYYSKIDPQDLEKYSLREQLKESQIVNEIYIF
jgi:Leucine-rich repeat (LRR) protein